jgi:alpha-tubulin suppressor-like RCC1 family protein
VGASERENSYNLFITICLIGTAAFTGGLWTTLLLRQLAGAFWLTLLVPAVLAGFTAAFLAENQSDSAIIAVLCVVLGVYSVGGFLLARWLFFRAQDVGWSGGIIALPEWKLFVRSENAVSTRSRKPIFALFKKELQLQQISLFGAIGLLGLHLGIIVLRKYHHFAQDSVGEALVSIFWMLWLVMAPVIGSMAVAEERRLGVMEGQFCLPVSRRVQFAVKGIFTLFLGVFLGSVMPMLLEGVAAGIGAQNPALMPEPHHEFDVFWLYFWVLTATSWLVLLGFFASTLARSFLMAVGLGIAAFFVSFMLVVANGHMISGGFTSVHSFLPVIIAVPTIIIILLWLAYLNFKNFHPGWPLWRRNLLGFAGAFVFIAVTSAALYNRAWEVFEPAEPAHGPAKLSLANPPIVRIDLYDTLIVRLPDGRVWFDYLITMGYNPDKNRIKWLWCRLMDPLPKSAAAPRFVAGSNWLSATAQRVDFYKSNEQGQKAEKHVTTSRDTVGIQADGTLWFSVTSRNGSWTGEMERFGNATNWLQLAPAHIEVLLLKNDGTLWRWGTNHLDWNNRQTNWHSLRIYQPNQIGTNSDWKEIGGTWWNQLARKADGSVWTVNMDDKSGHDELQRDTNLDPVSFQTLSLLGNNMAYVRPDGTLWMSWTYQQNGTDVQSDFVRVGTETNWTAVALNLQRLIALKSDGSLWQWHYILPWNVDSRERLIQVAQEAPTRLGIHNDWVAIASNLEDVIALAADGSLWLWPNREQYEQQTLLKLPKQPEFLGNILTAQ